MLAHRQITRLDESPEQIGGKAWVLVGQGSADANDMHDGE